MDVGDCVAKNVRILSPLIRRMLTFKGDLGYLSSFHMGARAGQAKIIFIYLPRLNTVFGSQVRRLICSM